MMAAWTWSGFGGAAPRSLLALFSCTFFFLFFFSCVVVLTTMDALSTHQIQRPL